MSAGKNSIQVSGIHEYPIKPVYKACMSVSLSNIYSGQEVSYSELIDNYLIELAGANFSKDELTADPLGYLLHGYEKEGNLFCYETSSLKQLQKFLRVRIEGVVKSDVTFEVTLSDEQIASYAASAIADARRRAELTAKSSGKRVGEISAIDDNNPASYIEGFFTNQEHHLRKYYVSVTFELI